RAAHVDAQRSYLTHYSSYTSILLFLHAIRTFTVIFFFFNDTAPTEIYTLSLHDALPISGDSDGGWPRSTARGCNDPDRPAACGADRKSTRLNSSHVAISYAVFCLKKKKCSLDALFDRSSVAPPKPFVIGAISAL